MSFKISDKKKQEGIKCCAYNCNNRPEIKKGGLCHKHYARRIKNNDPVQARYNQFRSKAAQRGKEVELTLEEFRKFCNDTGYILQKGKRGQNATIDRIDNSKGYSIDNIQLLTNRQNASKGNRQTDNGPYESLPF